MPIMNIPQSDVERIGRKFLSNMDTTRPALLTRSMPFSVNLIPRAMPG